MPTAGCAGDLGECESGAVSCQHSFDCASTRRDPARAHSKGLNLRNFSFPKVIVSPLGNSGPFLMKATSTVLIKSASSENSPLFAERQCQNPCSARMK